MIERKKMNGCKKGKIKTEKEKMWRVKEWEGDLWIREYGKSVRVLF